MDANFWINLIVNHPTVAVAILSVIAGWFLKKYKDNKIAQDAIALVDQAVDDAIAKGYGEKYKWLDLVALFTESLKKKYSDAGTIKKIAMPSNIKDKIINNPQALFEERMVIRGSDIVKQYPDYEEIKP